MAGYSTQMPSETNFSFHVLLVFRRCKARVRTNLDGTQLAVIISEHNHGILTERRKKGALKELYAKKKSAKGE